MFIENCQVQLFDAGSELFAICTGICVIREEQYSVVITLDEYKRIINGEEINVVIPHVNRADIEFLITGISPLGWKETFDKNYTEIDNIAETDLHQLKANWDEFNTKIKDFGIDKLYHFTDKENIASIINTNGLLSFKNCNKYDICINRTGGDEISLRLDSEKGLNNYIRLSFCKDHPMLHIAMKDGRIKIPVVLEVSPDVIFFKYTKFSNQNAIKSGVVVGETIDIFSGIKFDLFKNRYFDIPEYMRPFYQAEVLVLKSIPNKYILNINDFQN